MTIRRDLNHKSALSCFFAARWYRAGSPAASHYLRKLIKNLVWWKKTLVFLVGCARQVQAHQTVFAGFCGRTTTPCDDRLEAIDKLTSLYGGVLFT